MATYRVRKKISKDIGVFYICECRRRLSPFFIRVGQYHLFEHDAWNEAKEHKSKKQPWFDFIPFLYVASISLLVFALVRAPQGEFSSAVSLLIISLVCFFGASLFPEGDQ